jgi:hypothetical protein
MRDWALGLVGITVLAGLHACVVRKERPSEIETSTRCMGEVCTVRVFGPLAGDDDSVRRQVEEILRRKSRSALVVLKMAENKRDFDDAFSYYGAEIAPGTGPMPRLWEAYERASRKAAVIAYSRNGRISILRWDPVRRQRREIPVDSALETGLKHDSVFEVIDVGLDSEVNRLHMHVLVESMDDMPLQMRALRREFQIPEDTVLSVKFLGQRRVFDERFAVVSPLFGDLPEDFRAFRQDVAHWCTSPAKRAYLPVTCIDLYAWRARIKTGE